MPAASAADEPQIRRTDHNERFVAFAFAGADLVAETDIDGIITYAAGAFRSRFGEAPDAFVGRKLHSLVAPVDYETLDAAFFLLRERGRLHPMTIRLSDAGRTRLALAGLALPTHSLPVRICFTFARPPAPPSSQMVAATPNGLARVIESRLRSHGPASLGSCIGLLEIVGPGGAALLSGEAVGAALERAIPDAVASELAPGRYGLLGADGVAVNVNQSSAAIEISLRRQGIDVEVSGRDLSIDALGLNPTQAARALRHALIVFARDGLSGLDQTGLGSSLDSYMHQASRRTEILRRVIAAGHFTLLYQPIVRLSDRVPHHYEALIRPKPIAEIPLSNPQEFVMLIEALGLADELDLAVAALACTTAMQTGTKVAFNLSGQSVQNPAFRDRLVGALRASPACRAGLMIVEMTETAEIDNVAEACATANALRGIGVPFCLDDFGAGSNDMKLLRAIGANIVKLDGSYVAGIAKAGRERAFVAGMVEMARAVGADVVAERVEIEAEAEALVQLGVQFGQGWLFGRPAPLLGRSSEARRQALMKK